MRKVHDENEIDTWDVTVDYPLVTAKVTNRRLHISAIGYAKCDPTDKWNELFGVDLAYSRALSRISRKIERYLIKQSKNFVRR
jgi:hypothetical protein